MSWSGSKKFLDRHEKFLELRLGVGWEGAKNDYLVNINSMTQKRESKKRILAKKFQRINKRSGAYVWHSRLRGGSLCVRRKLPKLLQHHVSFFFKMNDI